MTDGLAARLIGGPRSYLWMVDYPYAPELGFWLPAWIFDMVRTPIASPSKYKYFFAGYFDLSRVRILDNFGLLPRVASSPPDINTICPDSPLSLLFYSSSLCSVLRRPAHAASLQTGSFRLPLEYDSHLLKILRSRLGSEANCSVTVAFYALHRLVSRAFYHKSDLTAELPPISRSYPLNHRHSKQSYMIHTLLIFCCRP
jgi:hypothetical protein